MPTKPYSQRIPSLHNGISTQAPSSRFPSQVADAENALFSLVNGVSTRAGTRHHVTIQKSGLAASSANFRMHRIVRDSSERYGIVHGRDSAGAMAIEVLDLLNPRNRVQYFTLGTPSAGTFTISFGGQTTAALAHNASAAAIQTAITGLTSVGSGNATVTASGGWFIVAFSDLLEYSGLIVVTSSLTGATIDGPYGTACKVTGNSGAIKTYLEGGSATASDLRFLTIVDTTIIANSQVATGTTTSNQALDPAKMPIQMQRTTLLPPTFALSQITWNAGSATKTAPVPMRMGASGEKRIADVSYHRGRLCFAMDEWLVTSQPDSLYNFFPFTADGTYNDSDPIVAQLGSSSVSIIDWLVPFRKSLLVLTRNGAQFEIGGGDVFTPKTATLTPSTTYATQRVRPAPISSFIYFAGVRENTSVVYEYAYDDVQVSYRASAITQHVDGLLPTSIRSMAASDNNDTLIVVPGSLAPDQGAAVASNGLGGGFWSNPNTWSGGSSPAPGHVTQIAAGDVVIFDSYRNSASSLYLYRTLRVADKLVQSAWTRYTFGIDRIMDVFIVEDTAYVLRCAYTQPANSGSTSSNYRLVLDTMPISTDPAAPATFDEQPRMDRRRIIRNGSVSGSDLLVRIEIPDYGINRAAAEINGVWQEYDNVVIEPIAGTDDANVRIVGGAALLNKMAVIGRNIPFSITTTRLFRSDDQGNAIVEGELFINKIVTDHTNSGPYWVTVSAQNRQDREFRFSPAGNFEKYGRFSVWTPGRAQDMTISIKNSNSAGTTTTRPTVITGVEFYGTHNTATEG
jgi:hypothetical protein